ncbi:MAG: helix-turn-helix domain-containing protein [Acidimicrobiia bacterium]|nr:helix-turn-helix domain-containing protein [Acidimicrobiia bacterium]
MTVGAEDLGRQLRRARQRLGFSLRDVHAVTAIPLNSLAALEEGDLAQLPSPVYARGYIRSYAEAVRLDGDRMALELWRVMEEAQVAATGGGVHAPGPRPRGRAPGPRPRGRAPATAPPPARTGPGPRARTANGHRPSSLAPLRQPASPWVPKPGRIKRMAPALERSAIAVLLIVLAVGIWDLQRSRPVKRPTQQAQASGVAQSHNAAPAVANASAQNTPTPTTPPNTSGTPVSDNGSLAVYDTGLAHFAVIMQATDAPCWLQARAGQGGPVLFEGTLQPGENHPFDASSPLWVRLGNLGHANVLVQGIPLVLPNKPSFPYNLLLQA